MNRSQASPVNVVNEPRGTVNKATWQRALHGPCKGLTRDVRVTLLACSEFMTRDGRLSYPEAALAEYAEIEPRALGRHRKIACDAGWLVRESSGHHGRTAVYQAALPVADDLLQRRRNRAKPAPDDLQQDDVASHYPTGYATSKQVADDRPSSKDLYGETAAGHFIFTFGSQRGHLLGGLLRNENRSPVTHADHDPGSGPSVAGFGLRADCDCTSPDGRLADVRLARDTA